MPKKKPTTSAAQSFMSMLRLNGWHFVIEPAKGIEFMEDLPSSVASEERFENWLKSSTEIK